MDTNEPLWLFVLPLDSVSIPYMVTGATAAILYGAPRLTNDLDLVLQLSEAMGRRLPSLFPASEFYLPPPEVVEVERIRPNRGHFNIIHMASGYKADAYLSGSDPLHAWGMEHRRQVKLDQRSVWLAPAEYVILRKLEFHQEGGSEKHLQDIRSIWETSGTGVDRGFIDSEISRRGLSESWRLAVSPP
jgi:hypothetical protein